MSSFSGIPRDPKKAMCSGGVNKMGTGFKSAKRTAAQDKSIAARKIRERITARVGSVFASRQRTGIYERQLSRLYVETDKLFRAHKGAIPIVDVDTQIREKIKSLGAFLNAPPPVFRSTLRAAIAADLFAYFERVCTVTANDTHPIEWTPRQADVFTSCM